MRRIYIVSYLRTILSPFAIKLYSLAIILWAIGRQVFVAKFVDNIYGLSAPIENFSFLARAFTNTELTVQALVLALFVLGLWLLRDLFTRRVTLRGNFI